MPLLGLSGTPGLGTPGGGGTKGLFPAQGSVGSFSTLVRAPVGGNRGQGSSNMGAFSELRGAGPGGGTTGLASDQQFDFANLSVPGTAEAREAHSAAYERMLAAYSSPGGAATQGPGQFRELIAMQNDVWGHQKCRDSTSLRTQGAWLGQCPLLLWTSETGRSLGFTEGTVGPSQGGTGRGGGGREGPGMGGTGGAAQG